MDSPLVAAARCRRAKLASRRSRAGPARPLTSLARAGYAAKPQPTTCFFVAAFVLAPRYGLIGLACETAGASEAARSSYQVPPALQPPFAAVAHSRFTSPALLTSL